MGTFFLGPLCGPLLAPIPGGAIAYAWGWRSTQWFLTIYGGVSLLILRIGIPETLASRKKAVAEVEPNVALSRTLSWVSSRQVAQSTAKWLEILKMILIDPLSILLYLRFPAVVLTVLYSSITLTSLYVLNISFQTTFSQPPYNFSVLIVGLLYTPHSVGYIVSSVLNGMRLDSIMQREAKKANRVDESGMYIYRPEDRMGENAWLGALIYPAAMIWYGWTTENH
ncbi:MFS multidrug resistance transporter [Histoplasma capsulatum var. duboisii H88]|uniref:MFS multidrug resistance transporter n=1 Tax=Ajellomyces capsulatus (strain H88) TaxID=544711 RepID=A0A8A1LEN7_AJEC8|nr:MFS multidrug resistance transporter [Histoplasma capsulatum var. duboisii H88]